jgi:hypothetical protein
VRNTFFDGVTFDIFFAFLLKNLFQFIFFSFLKKEKEITKSSSSSSVESKKEDDEEGKRKFAI